MIAAGVLRRFAGAAFKSTLGGGTIPVILLALFVGSSTTAYFKGVAHQKSKCNTATLTNTAASQRRELERLSGQLLAVQGTRERAAQRGIQDAATIKQWSDETDAFKQDISKQPIGCTLSADDAGRLLKIGN